MLGMGISQPWPEAMFVVTGQRHFDAGPIADYFRPLTEWITEQNRQNGDEPGWPDSDWIPPLPKGGLLIKVFRVTQFDNSKLIPMFALLIFLFISI